MVTNEGLAKKIPVSTLNNLFQKFLDGCPLSREDVFPVLVNLFKLLQPRGKEKMAENISAGKYFDITDPDD